MLTWTADVQVLPDMNDRVPVVANQVPASKRSLLVGTSALPNKSLPFASKCSQWFGNHRASLVVGQFSTNSIQLENSSETFPFRVLRRNWAEYGRLENGNWVTTFFPCGMSHNSHNEAWRRRARYDQTNMIGWIGLIQSNLTGDPSIWWPIRSRNHPFNFPSLSTKTNWVRTFLNVSPIGFPFIWTINCITPGTKWRCSMSSSSSSRDNFDDASFWWFFVSLKKTDFEFLQQSKKPDRRVSLGGRVVERGQHGVDVDVVVLLVGPERQVYLWRLQATFSKKM